MDVNSCFTEEIAVGQELGRTLAVFGMSLDLALGDKKHFRCQISLLDYLVFWQEDLTLNHAAQLFDQVFRVILAEKCI